MTNFDTLQTVRGDKINAKLHSTDEYMYATALSLFNGLDYDEVTVSRPLPVSLPTAGLDAFGRQRISAPYTVFDSKLLQDKQPVSWDELLLNGATSVHSVEHARARLATASANDGALRQTFQRFNYQPGKSQLIFMTFAAPQEVNVTKRIGPLEVDDNATLTPINGVFLEVTASGFSFNIAKNGSVTETVSSGSFNLDTLDGSGPSGVTLDLDAPQILVVDYEWLGVGSVRAGFVIDGAIIYAHVFQHANAPAFDSVYMSTPNLPLSYSILQTGAGSGMLDCICGSVISEGGIEELGVLRTHNNGVTAVSCSSTANTYALLAVRKKLAYADIPLVLQGLSTIVTSNDNALITLAFNPTISGGSLSFSGLTNSIAEVAVGDGSLTLSGGVTVASAYLTQQSRELLLPWRMLPRPGKAIDGTMDVYVLGCRPVSSALNALGAMTWLEQV